MGFMKGVKVETAIISLILIIIFLQFIGAAIIPLQVAGHNISSTPANVSSGLPLGDFFAKNGLLILIFVAGAFLLVFRAVMGKTGSR